MSRILRCKGVEVDHVGEEIRPCLRENGLAVRYWWLAEEGIPITGYNHERTRIRRGLQDGAESAELAVCHRVLECEVNGGNSWVEATCVECARAIRLLGHG